MIDGILFFAIRHRWHEIKTTNACFLPKMTEVSFCSHLPVT